MFEDYKRKHAPPYERLMQRTEKTATCWLWHGYRQRSGHGQIGTNGDGKKRYTACHRLSWEHHHGPVPEGLCVLHRCDVPHCVNPDHLFLGSRSDNSADKVAKGRVPRGNELPQAKLTEDKVRQIRAVYEELGRGETAKRFGVSGQAVYEVWSRRKWAWVE